MNSGLDVGRTSLMGLACLFDRRQVGPFNCPSGLRLGAARQTRPSAGSASVVCSATKESQSCGAIVVADEEEKLFPLAA